MDAQGVVGLDEAAVCRDLQASTYEDVGRRYGISRGKVYEVAVRHRARKNEARIRERAEERKRRQREFLQEVLNATQTSDVLDFLDGIPDDAIDFHLTSIPYNVGKPYGGHPDADRRRFHYYLGWTLQVLSEMARTLRAGGTLALQVGSTRTDAGQRYPLDCLLFEHLRSMGLTFQDRVVWEFPHGLTPRRRLAERYEVLLVFSKGDPLTFNATPARTPQKEPGKRAFKGPNRGRLSGHPLGAFPTNVWRIRHLGANHKERTLHPAQFPEELARRAILLYSQPGDLVCDVFSGSGTTQVAALATGRAFVGCDLYYQDLRHQRLAKLALDFDSRLPGVTVESVAVWQAEARPVHRPAQQTLPMQDLMGPGSAGERGTVPPLVS